MCEMKRERNGTVFVRLWYDNYLGWLADTSQLGRKGLCV